LFVLLVECPPRAPGEEVVHEDALLVPYVHRDVAFLDRRRPARPPKKEAPPAVSAEGLAREFEKDPAAARKKYAAEANLTLLGNVTEVKGKEVRLQTGSKVRVLLKAKEVRGGVEAGKEGMALTASARVKSFDGKEVVVECEEVVVAPRIDLPQGINPFFELP
jgi:hypothetical protein